MKIRNKIKDLFDVIKYKRQKNTFETITILYIFETIVLETYWKNILKILIIMELIHLLTKLNI